MSPLTIIHGGQTGVDRGAHLGAQSSGVRITGFAPSDNRDEHGLIPADVLAHLLTCDAEGYPARTRMNVRSATGVVIVTPRRVLASPGTKLTKRIADEFRKPVIVVESAQGIDGVALGEFLAGLTPRWDTRVMVAGPRASKWADGERVARLVVEEMIDAWGSR